MKTLKTLSFCFIVLAISQGSVIKADDLFANTGNQNVFKISQQNSPVTQTANNKISKSDLAQFVQAMGYEVKDLGENIYLVRVAEGEWTFEPVISLSQGGTRIWVHTNLKTYPSKNSLTAEQLIKLLDANLTYGPVVFNYSLKTNRISVSRSFKNENLMPSEMKKLIIDMCKVAVETESLWNIKGSSVAPVPRQTKKATQPYWLKNVSK